MHAMALALDHQIGDFLQFLSRQFGLSQVWVALSADHGIAPLTEVAKGLHIPAAVTSNSDLGKELNKAIGAKLGKSARLRARRLVPYRVRQSAKPFPRTCRESRR